MCASDDADTPQFVTVLCLQLEADKRGIDRRFREGILEVHQKSGYKNQILERKLELIHNELETKETQLGEVLASANLDPVSLDTVTRRMEVKTHRNSVDVGTRHKLRLKRFTV